MKQARVAYAGAIHSAEPDQRGLRLADGRRVSEEEVVWPCPFEPGTIIALGLNYAEHAKELSFTAREEPLVFLKGPGSVIGHRGVTRRPAGGTFMHYECELAVVIGRTTRAVTRAQALSHGAGYCIANDYAIRDYLENWYRPNLRVKIRDGGTVLGPWLVDTTEIRDPGNLELRTYVNGKQVQQGNTRDLITDVPGLIEYLSSFMTLTAGDVILTGTPAGVVNVNEGDEVVCEIDGLGRLQNTMASDAIYGRGAPQRRSTISSTAGLCRAQPTSKISTRLSRNCFPRWPPAVSRRSTPPWQRRKPPFPHGLRGPPLNARPCCVGWAI